MQTPQIEKVFPLENIFLIGKIFKSFSGFGDFVPAQVGWGEKISMKVCLKLFAWIIHQNKGEDAPLRIAYCSVYLLFGIALLAMSFNLVQEEVITKVKSVAKRLGIIKDVEMEE
jgi:hypothetical protein